MTAASWLSMDALRQYMGHYPASWNQKVFNTAYVFADGLREHGFTRLATDLTKFTTKLEERATSGRIEQALTEGEIQGKWKPLRRRIYTALLEIQTKPNIWVGSYGPGEPRTAVVRFVHAVNPAPGDVQGPYPVRESDLEDLPSIRRWLAKLPRGKIGQLRSWYKSKGRIMLFPKAYYHAVVIEPGQKRLRTEAREVNEIANLLASANYDRPLLYARILRREGLNGENVKSLLREGRTSPRSLEMRYGFRLSKRARLTPIAHLAQQPPPRFRLRGASERYRDWA